MVNKYSMILPVYLTIHTGRPKWIYFCKNEYKELRERVNDSEVFYVQWEKLSRLLIRCWKSEGWQILLVDVHEISKLIFHEGSWEFEKE